jgi:hypothetical protein
VQQVVLAGDLSLGVEEPQLGLHCFLVVEVSFEGLGELDLVEDVAEVWRLQVHLVALALKVPEVLLRVARDEVNGGCRLWGAVNWL